MKGQFLLMMALLLCTAIFASTEKTSMKDLPIVLQYRISQNFGKDDSAYHIKKNDLGYTALNHLNGVTGLISEKGLQVRVKGFTWSLLLKGLNSGGTYLPLNSTRDTVSLSDNKLEFRSHGLTSWYINGPLGIQQGWTLEKRLSGNGGYPSLCFEEEGDLSAGNVPEKGSSLSLACEDGTIVLNYQGLYAYDALGKVIPAWFEKAGKHVCITLDDKDAIYPVTIDPYVQAAKLTASDGGINDYLGTSVSVSSDGSTVVAGAPFVAAVVVGEHTGAAYVYVKTGGIWTQAAILSDPLCVTYDNMGYSVSVNSDGSTVVAGVPAAAAVAGGIQRGAAYVFARWAWGWDDHVRFTKLTASDGANYDRLGTSVSFSSDGSTVVAGAPYAVVGGVLRGAAYVYVKPGGWWSWYSAGGGTETEDAKLTASDGANGDNLGYSVSVSSNGSTIVAGAPYANAGGIGSGAAYVFGAQLNATASVLSNVSCYGGSNGSVTVSVSGGATPYSYDWSTSPVQHTQSATGLTAGTYWVTVTDANSSTATSSTSVSQPASPLSAAAGMLTNVSCYGGSNGSTNVMVSGGTTSYSYDWSTIPVQHTQSATGLSAGTYWVTVTDANSCTAASSATVIQPASALTAVASVVNNVSIYQGSDGSATVTPGGGTTPYSYSWSTTPSQTTQTATSLTAGTYWVTVTDANSCTVTSSVTITQPTPPSGQVTDLFFSNVGSHQFAVDWTRGNGDGCAVFVLQGITGLAPPVNNTFYPANTVFGNPASEIGSTGWYCVYDGTGTTVTITGLSPSATYRVHICEYKLGSITYNTGSAKNNPLNNTTNSSLGATASVISNVSCYGGSDGSVTVSVSGGNPSYTYSWSTIPAQPTQTVSALTAGTYTVTVTDGVGETVTSGATVTQPDVLTAAAGVTSNVRCFGGSDGAVNVSVSGGTGPFTYIWTGGSTGSSVSNLTAGTYYVTVTDAHSCTATSSTSVSQPAVLTANAGVLTNVSCFGGSDGSAEVTVSGGTTSYSYAWSTAPVQHTQSATDLTAGTYWVTVTDANSCTATSSTTVTQPALLTANAGVITNVSCYGGSYGSTYVTVSGGTTSYSYTWSTTPVQHTQSATGLTAGTYWVTVTDANSCTATSSTTVTQPAVLTANAGVLTNVSCYGESNGSTNVTVSGGTTSYTYAWSTSPVQHTQSATGLTAGTYWVTVTDANSCTATSSATLTQPPMVVPGLTGPGTVCQNYPGNIYITESGMSNYHWVVSSGGIVTAGGTTLDNSVTITWNLPGAKSVSVNYSTPAGCTADDPTIKNITVNPAPAPDISGPTVVNQGETATYSTPFVSGHLYNWNVVFGTFISCEPGCITVNWAHYCNITVPGQVTVTETIPETGCSKMVTLLITIN